MRRKEVNTHQKKKSNLNEIKKAGKGRHVKKQWDNGGVVVIMETSSYNEKH